MNTGHKMVWMDNAKADYKWGGCRQEWGRDNSFTIHCESFHQFLHGEYRGIGVIVKVVWLGLYMNDWWYKHTHTHTHKGHGFGYFQLILFVIIKKVPRKKLLLSSIAAFSCLDAMQPLDSCSPGSEFQSE